MAPSEKEKIIEEGFDAIRKVYNLRGELEAAKESNRKLSDRVANLEVTIRTLNSAIDKKDAEIRALKATSEALERKRDFIHDNYLKLCHECDANENIMRRMIADNRKKKEEIKRLKEELTELVSDFHELRQKPTDMYITGTLRGFSTSDFTEFAKWFKRRFR